MPPGGNQPRRTAKNCMARMPSQKAGWRPAWEKPRMILSAVLPRRLAAKAPRGMATAMARKMAMAARGRVTGKAAAYESATA